MGDILLWVLIIGGSILALYLYFRFFKLFKVKSIVFVDGGLGSGKSFLSVSLAIRLHKKAVRQYRLKKCLLYLLTFVNKDKWLPKYQNLEKPLLYSNIRLRNYPFVKVTRELLYRNKFRFAYRSVVLFDEFSLMADQMTYKDRQLNERLTLFMKLFRHEVRGGHLIINSQSVSDLHFSLKYVLSDYLYIHHLSKWPFVYSLKVQEIAYCPDKEGGQVATVHTSDIEDTLKTMFVFSRYKKYYDTYCYSIFTDDLPVYKLIEFNEKGADIKDTRLVTFKEYQFLLENLERNLNNEKVE